MSMHKHSAHKQVFLLALTILFNSVAYVQDMSALYKLNTSISKDDCWKKINQWAVSSFYQYKTNISYEDKAAGEFVVKGRFNPEIDGMICTSYKQKVPIIEFTIRLRCEDSSFTTIFEELYYTFKQGTVTALEINNIAVLQASTSELKIMAREGNKFTYNGDLEKSVGVLARILTEANEKAIDKTLKRKVRKQNQKLYDSYSSEFRVYAKVYNDTKTFKSHLLRELGVYLQ